MEARKVLELVEAGELQELKALCKEELYTNALATKTGAKQRYSAMKRYLKDSLRYGDRPSFTTVGEYLSSNVFCDGYCLALTREDIGELPRFDISKGEYLNVRSVMGTTLSEATVVINTTELFAKAAEAGYKYKASEKRYLLQVNSTYFDFILFDKVFSIIREGDTSEIVLPKNAKSPMLLKTSVGEALILPIHLADTVNKIVIEAII